MSEPPVEDPSAPGGGGLSSPRGGGLSAPPGGGLFSPRGGGFLSPRVGGFLVAAATLAIDQANKLWLLDVFDIEARQPVRLAPFFDVIAARNPGISYSLLSAHSATGRWALVCFTALATLLIGVWLWRTTTRVAAAALGLIVGGALGNAIDRFSYGWVADFYYFHVGSFHWYVFNLADVAIVLGVALLLLDSFLFSAPPSPEAPGPAGQDPGRSTDR